ncbi:hypothetical protein N9Q05_02755 [bacterium]|nr:hypothetical protein [bacterium]
MRCICFVAFIVPTSTKTDKQRKREHQACSRFLSKINRRLANPANYDVDLTVQESNTSHPALVNLLLKVAILTKTADDYLLSKDDFTNLNFVRSS